MLAGPAEATSLGNLLVQAMATGEIESLDELRDVVRRSADVVRYEPGGTRVRARASSPSRGRSATRRASSRSWARATRRCAAARATMLVKASGALARHGDGGATSSSWRRRRCSRCSTIPRPTTPRWRRRSRRSRRARGGARRSRRCCTRSASSAAARTVVGHTHPVPVLALLCSPHAEALATHLLFPDQIVVLGRRPLFVPYVDPGLALARRVRDDLARTWRATASRRRRSTSPTTGCSRSAARRSTCCRSPRWR